MAEKTKFACYLTPEDKSELERRCHEDGSRSQTEFVEHALRFYLDYLSANNAGSYLPTAVSAAIDGRLGMFESRMAKLLYKQAVEMDIGMGILADVYEFDEENMRRRRAKSVSNVKRTNGQLRFEQIVKDAYYDREEQAKSYDNYDEDDGWQG